MNLLPAKEKEILRKGLKLRLVVVAAMLITLSFLVGTAMLFPPYFLLKGHSAEVMSANSSEETESEETTKDILNLPKEMETKLKFFQSNLSSVSARDSFSKIIDRLPENVKLNSISFTRNQTYKTKKGILVVISGIALDRDSLVSFGTLLKESGSFYLVDVPVSSLTKENNLPFSMNIFIEEQK